MLVDLVGIYSTLGYTGRRMGFSFEVRTHLVARLCPRYLRGCDCDCVCASVSCNNVNNVVLAQSLRLLLEGTRSLRHLGRTRWGKWRSKRKRILRCLRRLPQLCFQIRFQALSNPLSTVSLAWSSSYSPSWTNSEKSWLSRRSGSWTRCEKS